MSLHTLRPERLEEELRTLVLLETLQPPEPVDVRRERFLRQHRARPLTVRRLHPLLSLLVHGHRHLYAVGAADHRGLFTKHTMEHYPDVLPEPARRIADDLAARDVPFDEVVVFQELGVDPYLAVRSGETWYALYRWARPETLPIAGRALMRQV